MHIPFFDWTVTVKGADLQVLAVGEANSLRDRGKRHHRMLIDRELDACEVSLSMARNQGRPFTAIPVFPRRLFSQSHIWIGADSSISALKGSHDSPRNKNKTVGLVIAQLITAITFGMVFLSAAPLRVYAEEFYKGKTIKFVVGYSPGGLFDSLTRLVARHFSKHVPGNPNVIVDNMTGAGGILLGNHLYHVAKPDGLTVGAWATPLILQQLLGTDAITFDGRRFGYLGAPGAEDAVCAFNEASGIKTVDDWFAAKRPIKIGAIAPGTSTSDVPKLFQAVMGLPMQVIEGFKGGAEVRLAVENGEVDGYCGSWQSVKLTWSQAVTSGRIRLVLQMTLASHPEIKQVPLAVSYAKTNEARRLLRVVSVYRNPYIYSVPPATPADRLQILQKAFVDTVEDAELLAEAKKSKQEIEPLDGPTIANTIAGLYEFDSATLARMREVLKK